jgi:hypothetical protein
MSRPNVGRDGRNGQCGSCTVGTRRIAILTVMPTTVSRPRTPPRRAPTMRRSHAAHDSLKLKMLLDPEARKAEFLKYQKAVGAYEARHAAGQGKPQEAKPEHASLETREHAIKDRETRAALAEVDVRTARLPDQAAKKQKPERPWLPRADMVKAVSDIGLVATTVAVALGDASAKWDAVAAGAVTAIVSNITWANRRWKEKHGDRPEG